MNIEPSLECYRRVAAEIEQNVYEPALKLKSFSLAEGDPDRAKAVYVRLRAEQFDLERREAEAIRLNVECQKRFTLLQTQGRIRIKRRRRISTAPGASERPGLVLADKHMPNFLVGVFRWILRQGSHSH